jgi:hypothetical protein
MFTILLVPGPPFDTPMWGEVQRRLETHNLKARCWTMLNSATGSFEDETALLAAEIERSDESLILLAHGTALPLVIAAARIHPPAAIVLTNGTISDADIFGRGLRMLSRAPGPLASALFSGTIALPFLASSLGLRRAVVNPYVMDHDTTVAVCGPILSNSERRTKMLNFFKTSKKSDCSLGNPPAKTLLCWGDSDPITSRSYSSFMESKSEQVDVSPVPGGRFLHPIERPWELADRVSAWAQKMVTTT